MTSGYILIAAILVLGGVIATVGDRLGTKVGKARLSLFNLRPKKTAVLVTIATGSVISASTLAILFAVSDQLRTGVFELGRIQGQLRDATTGLKAAQAQQQQAEVQLSKAKEEQATVQKRLNQIRQSLNAAIAQQQQTAAQLKQIQGQLGQAEAARMQAVEKLQNTQTQLNQAETDRERTEAERASTQAELDQTQSQLNTVSQQASGLRAEISQLQGARKKLDQQIQILSKQQDELEAAVQTLDHLYQSSEFRAQSLRKGNVALLRGQVLASGIVRIEQPGAAQEAVEQLLREANRVARQATQPGTGQPIDQIIQVPKPDVDRLIRQLKDGRTYILQVFSTENYLLGEKTVRVVANATMNRVVFLPGETIAATTLDPLSMTDDQMGKRLEQLIAAAEFRGKGQGIIREGVFLSSPNGIGSLVQFMEQVKQQKEPLDIQAIAAETIYTAGPLRLQLVASQNGQVLFRTL